MSKELNKGTSELLITVSAKKEEWKAAQDKAFKNIAKDLQVAGFRKGNVPAHIAKKNIAQSDVFTKAITASLDMLVGVAAKEIKEELILDSPTYQVSKVSDTELEVVFVYPVYPDFKIGDYKNVKAKYEEKKVSNDVVETELKNLQERNSILISKDKKIENGDTANFDFEGSVDGVLFDGGTAKAYELEIGSGQFIPGFEEQMIGLSKGETKDVKVTFPADYHSEDLKGKESIFKVTINEVKTKDVAKLDDNLVKEANIPNVTTIDEFKKYITTIFTEQEKQNARRDFQTAAFKELKEGTEIPLPQSLVAKEMQNVSKQFEDQLKQQGMDPAKYLEMTGLTNEALFSQHKAQAVERLNDSLIFAEIAKLEKIEIKEEDYAKEYVKLAKAYGQSEEAVKGTITKEQMQIPMTNDRVIDVLIKGSSSK